MKATENLWSQGLRYREERPRAWKLLSLRFGVEGGWLGIVKEGFTWTVRILREIMLDKESVPQFPVTTSKPGVHFHLPASS